MSCVTECCQTVACQGRSSRTSFVSSGVLQETVLGPPLLCFFFLFFLFLNPRKGLTWQTAFGSKVLYWSYIMASSETQGLLVYLKGRRALGNLLLPNQFQKFSKKNLATQYTVPPSLIHPLKYINYWGPGEVPQVTENCNAKWVEKKYWVNLLCCTEAWSHWSGMRN